MSHTLIVGNARKEKKMPRSYVQCPLPQPAAPCHHPACQLPSLTASSFLDPRQGLPGRNVPHIHCTLHPDRPRDAWFPRGTPRYSRAFICFVRLLCEADLDCSGSPGTPQPSAHPPSPIPIVDCSSCLGFGLARQKSVAFRFVDLVVSWPYPSWLS